MRRTATVLAAAALTAGLALPASAAVINGHVVNAGRGAGFVLTNDQHTHYRYVQEIAAAPSVIPPDGTVLGSVTLYDPASMDTAQVELVSAGAGYAVDWGLAGGFQYDNNLVAPMALSASLSGATAVPGDTVRLALYYNPASVTHEVVFGATDYHGSVVTSFTAVAHGLGHAEQFSEAGTGGGMPGTFTSVEENFYSSTGPAKPVTAVLGFYGDGGLAEDDTSAGLSAATSLSAAGNGSFTLAG